MVLINVILGSTREVSIGQRLFKYLENEIAPTVSEKEEINFKFIHLEDYDLPFFYEEIMPRDNLERQLKSNEQKWVTDMKTADGYLFVTPQYDNSISGVLKNALDFIGWEGAKKPAKIISYSDDMFGGQIGGQALMPILESLGMIVLPTITKISNLTANYNATGFLTDNAPEAECYQKDLLESLHEIGIYAKILKENPYHEFND